MPRYTITHTRSIIEQWYHISGESLEQVQARYGQTQPVGRMPDHYHDTGFYTSIDAESEEEEDEDEEDEESDEHWDYQEEDDLTADGFGEVYHLDDEPF